MASFLNTISAMGALVMAATPLVALPAFAHAEGLEPQRIRIADLDMSRPDDQARFAARVEAAAGAMCQSYGEISANRACREAVRAEAMEKVAALPAAQVATVQPVAIAQR